MARIKIEEIIDYLESKFRNALSDTVKNLSDESINEYDLYRAFKREVGYKCSTWEDVPDSCVEED